MSSERPPSLATPTNIGKPRSRWNGSGWTVEPYMPPSADLYLEAEKERLKNLVTTRRVQVEQGGIVLPNGAKILTAISDQTRITGVLANWERLATPSITFKSANGFVELTYEELDAIATLITRHVQACFLAECLHYQAIDELTRETLGSYNLEAFWPGGDDAT